MEEEKEGVGRSGKGIKNPMDMLKASNKVSDGFVCLYVGWLSLWLAVLVGEKRQEKETKGGEVVHGSQIEGVRGTRADQSESVDGIIKHIVLVKGLLHSNRTSNFFSYVSLCSK